MRNVIHVKGFTSGLTLRDRLDAIEILLGLMNEHCREGTIVLAWDGDKWAYDSFTSVIASCAQLWHGTVLLNCYASKGRSGAVNDVWSNRMSNFVVAETDVVVDRSVYNPEEYCEHGLAAMRATGGTLLFCIGGGSCVAMELLKTPEHVKVVIFDVRRGTQQLAKQESLASFVRDTTRVKVIESQSTRPLPVAQEGSDVAPKVEA